MIEVFAAADALALHFDKQRKRLTLALYLCGGVLAFCLWTALDGVLQLAMSAGYLLCIACAAAIFARLGSDEISEAPLYCRFLAEALRTQFYLVIDHRAADNPGTSPSDDSPHWEVLKIVDGLLSQHLYEIGWVREALRIGAIDPNVGNRVPPSLREALVDFWISGQIAFFRKRAKEYEGRSRRLGHIRLALVVIGIPVAAATLALDFSGLGRLAWRHVGSIGAAIFPALALLVQSYVDRLAFEEQRKNYQRMLTIFERVQTVLVRRAEGREPPAFIVRELGLEAIAECASWLMLRKSKPPEMPT